MRPTKPPTTESLLPPILSLLTSTPPNPYSAHQKCLTTTARLVHSHHPSIAIEILSATSRELFKLNEPGSGCELGVRMITIMMDSEVPVDEQSKTSITQLLALTPASGPWRKKLGDSAIQWSTSICPTGDPSLHQYLGELYHRDHQYTLAEIHYLASGKRDAAKSLAKLMYDWCDQGRLDPGPYAIRGTLPYLSIRNILPAQTFLQTFIADLSTSTNLFPENPTDSPSVIRLTTSPVLNFLQLAVLTCQRAPAPGVTGVEARGMNGGVGREWESLVSRYKRYGGVLGEPPVLEVLQQISTEIFLIPPPRNAGGGDMLQNLMGSLFGGGGGSTGPRAIGSR